MSKKTKQAVLVLAAVVGGLWAYHNVVRPKTGMG